MLPYRVQVVLGVQLRCVASCFTFNQEKGEGGRKEGRDVADDGRGGGGDRERAADREAGRPSDGSFSGLDVCIQGPGKCHDRDD